MAKDGQSGFEAVIGPAAAAAGRRELVGSAEDIERSLLGAGSPAREARRLATMRMVADLLCERAIAGKPLRSASGPIGRAARLTDLPEPTVRAMVGHIALRDPRTIAQPAPQAIRIQLQIVALLASLREASFWAPEADGRLACLAHAQGVPSPGLARVAARCFAAAAQTPVTARRRLVAVPVEGSRGPRGALAARAGPGGAGIATMGLRAAAPLIGLALDREAQLFSAEARAADAAGAARRALVRFGFDVHDGPAQEIAALQGEIRAFEGQVSEAFASDPRGELLLGRLQDLEARGVAVAEQIRALANSARSPAAAEAPVEEVLRGELRELGAAAGIEARLDLSGPVDEATDSQRIALLRGVQEALRNVHEHSGAERVAVRVEAGEERIEVEVEDDGCGFEPERVRGAAPATGRMGLAGIVERARLLGGACEVRSAPGGPTSIRMSLPRWRSPGGDGPGPS